jgi:hypothetical protein
LPTHKRRLQCCTQICFRFNPNQQGSLQANTNACTIHWQTSASKRSPKADDILGHLAATRVTELHHQSLYGNGEYIMLLD